MNEINSRRDMKDTFKIAMSKAYESLREEQELEAGQTYLKSYLIESNTDNTEKVMSASDRAKLRSTRDEGFFHIRAEEEEEIDLYLDRLDDRFWVLHSIENADILKKFVNNQINPRFTGLDFLWFSNNFLEDISREPDKDFQRLSLSFKDQFKNIEEDSTVDKLTMRLWAETPGTVENVLSTFKGQENLSGSTSLRSIGIRKYFDDDILMDDITYKGKFKAYGESVEGHFHEVRDIKNKYKDRLGLLEEKYRIDYPEAGSGYTVEGAPVIIEFKREIQKMESFMSSLFSSKKPFRMWSICDEVQEDYYRCPVVDMHTGDKMNLEISPNWMRIYLPKGSCGNTIFRLYANVQHFFDSQAKLIGEDNEQII